MRVELTQLLQVGEHLWLRCLPLFLLTPYLAFGAFPWLWAAALSGAFAVSLAPLVSAACGAQAACVPALTWSGALSELVSGTVIALCFALPFVAFRITGAIAQALAGAAASAADSGNTLGRAAAMVACVSAASTGAFSGVSRWLLAVPLPAAGAGQQPQLYRSLSDEVVRAFDVGVSLAGPLLLGALFAAVFVGLWTRIAGARFVPVGPLLLPWLGIALVSLCVASWLDSVPELVRAFAQSGARLLGGLP